MLTIRLYLIVIFRQNLAIQSGLLSIKRWISPTGRDEFVIVVDQIGFFQGLIGIPRRRIVIERAWL